MKVEIDIRPVDEHHPEPYSAIRLYPENNKDMTDMEWLLGVMDNKPEKIIRAGETSSFHYAVTFQVKK